VKPPKEWPRDSAFTAGSEQTNNVKRVPICVPTYNRAGSLGIALRSILDQTWRDLSLIVVDDSSKDGTEALVRSFADDRLRYVRNESNLGMTGNWNRCRSLALETGAAYIGIYHHDDYYAPSLLEREVGFLETNPRVGLVYPAFHYHSEADARYSLRRPYSRDRVMTAIEVLDSLCRSGIYCIAAPAVLARQDAYQKAGEFDVSFNICPDLDLWWRMMEFYDIGYISEPLHIHTVHKAQVSSSPRAVADATSQCELKRALDKAWERIASRQMGLDAAKYRECISRYCAKQALLAAKDALLSGEFVAAHKMCRGARQLSCSLNIRWKSIGLRLLANSPGRFFCSAAIGVLRQIRAKTQRQPDHMLPSGAPDPI